MKVISPYTNIIPVLVKCDHMTRQQISEAKKQVLETCFANPSISIFKFGMSDKELLEHVNGLSGGVGTIPFALSFDEDGDWIAEGMVDEFELLKNQILFHFKEDLRQESAEKFVAWRYSKSKKK
jgi:hypothetical protein